MKNFVADTLLQSNRVISAVLIYYIATHGFYVGIFGEWCVYNCESIAGPELLARYYAGCALIPLVVMPVLLIGRQGAMTKIVAVVMFALILNNSMMAIDAHKNPDYWVALEVFDILTQTLADVVLIAAGLLCLMLKLFFFLLSRYRLAG